MFSGESTSPSSLHANGKIKTENKIKILKKLKIKTKMKKKRLRKGKLYRVIVLKISVSFILPLRSQKGIVTEKSRITQR